MLHGSPTTVQETNTLRDQPLPRSANGKLLKRNLRDEIIDSTEA